MSLEVHIFLASIDGQWRWSPAGRLRVDGIAQQIDSASLTRLLLRRARVTMDPTALSISFDGRTPLPHHEPVALTRGCTVHLLSPPRTVEVSQPALAALFHLQVETLGPEALREWAQLLHAVLRRRKPVEAAMDNAACIFVSTSASPDADPAALLSRARKVLLAAAEPHPPPSSTVPLEIVPTASAAEAIATLAGHFRIPAEVPAARFRLVKGGAVVSSMAEVAPGDALQLELPVLFPLDVRCAPEPDAEGAAPLTTQVWVSARFAPSGSPECVGTLAELKSGLEGAWGVPRHRQLLSFGATSLDDEQRSLQEYGVRGAAVLDAARAHHEPGASGGAARPEWSPTTGVVGVRNGVPVCCTSLGTSTHFWWFLSDVEPGAKVVMKYRDGTGAWTGFSGAYEVHHGWWRSPIWGARGNTKYEQGVWVDGTCLADGLFGPEASEIAEQAPLPE